MTTGKTGVTAGHSFRTFDWKAATALMQDLVSAYELRDELGVPATMLRP
jgi:hypothetical protein